MSEKRRPPEDHGRCGSREADGRVGPVDLVLVPEAGSAARLVTYASADLGCCGRREWQGANSGPASWLSLRGLCLVASLARTCVASHLALTTPPAFVTERAYPRPLFQILVWYECQTPHPHIARASREERRRRNEVASKQIYLLTSWSPDPSELERNFCFGGIFLAHGILGLFGAKYTKNDAHACPPQKQKQSVSALQLAWRNPARCF